MGAGGKGGGGGGSGSYDYYGSIAGAVCLGVVDELVALIVDGKEVWPAAPIWKEGESLSVSNLRAYGARTWQCTSAHTSSSANKPPDATKWSQYTLARGVSDYTDVTVVGYGTARIYWGTSTQTQNSILATAGNEFGDNHPDYKGICYIVFDDFLFGRERTSAPNVEVVVRRKPNQSIVTGAAANTDDGQANGIAAIAEVATSPSHGINLASADIDATTFQAIADAHHTDADNLYSSPLLTAQSTLRSFAADLALLTDSWVRFNPSTRKLEAGQWLHGVQPSTYTSITVADLASVPQFETQSWKDVKTGATITFTDRERSYKQTSDKVDDLRAVTVVGENRRESLQRPNVTRRTQALQHAAETLRTFGRPQITCKVSVRREKARSIKPGDWVQLDIDLEPGGGQLLQFFKVTERTVPYRGPIGLTLDAEETLTPIPYTPTSDVPGQLPDLTVPEIVTYRVFDAPTGFSKTDKLSVGTLAVREAANIVGFDVHFAVSGPLQNIGTHSGFAVAGTLDADYSDTDSGVITLDIPDQVDIALLSNSISAAEAEFGEYLLLLFKLDGTDIDNDSDGYQWMEVFKISDIDATGGTAYEITATRAAFDTKPRAFLTGAEAWIVRRGSLTFFEHQAFFDAYIGVGFGNFQLQPFTALAVRDIDDCTEFQFTWPGRRHGLPLLTVETPAWSGNTPPWTQTFGSTGTTQQFKGYIEDLDGDLVSLDILLRAPGAEETIIYSRSIPLQYWENFDVSYTFSSAGQYDVIIRAMDKLGLRGERVITIYNAPSGTKVDAPYAAVGSNKAGKGIYWQSRVNAQLYCDTSGATIEYLVSGSIYTSPPAGTWTTYTPGTYLSALSGVVINSKIWMRAKKSGLTDSDVNMVQVTQNISDQLG